MSDTATMVATAALQAALIVATAALLIWVALEWRRLLRERW